MQEVWDEFPYHFDVNRITNRAHTEFVCSFHAPSTYRTVTYITFVRLLISLKSIFKFVYIMCNNNVFTRHRYIYHIVPEYSSPSTITVMITIVNTHFTNHSIYNPVVHKLSYCPWEWKSGRMHAVKRDCDRIQHSDAYRYVMSTKEQLSLVTF